MQIYNEERIKQVNGLINIEIKQLITLYKLMKRLYSVVISLFILFLH